jgi:hypothetical protein
MSQEANKPTKEQRVKILWISAAPDFKYEARIGVYTQHTGNYLLKTFREFAAAREQYLKLGQGEVVGMIDQKRRLLFNFAICRKDVMKQEMLLLSLPRTTLQHEYDQFNEILFNTFSYECPTIHNTEGAIPIYI